MFILYRITLLSCRNEKLSGIVGTPIRYVTLLLRDRRISSLRYRNRLEITVLMCEQKPYPVFSSIFWHFRISGAKAFRYNVNIA